MKKDNNKENDLLLEIEEDHLDHNEILDIRRSSDK